MLAAERRNQILETLQEKKHVVVSELSQVYGVSEETIRRDLERMEKDGLVEKSYGGATLVENSIFDLPFDVRRKHQVEQKEKMAELIADLVHDGEAIMMDTSSTALYVAQRLKDKKDLTVVTNSIEIAVNISDKSDWNIISTGGTLREKSLGLFGSRTDESFASYYADKAIFSCMGLTISGGFMDSYEEDASCKRVMMKHARERILVADSSKFGQTAFTRVACWDSITHVVTDIKPSDKWLKQFEKCNIKCIYGK